MQVPSLANVTSRKLSRINHTAFLGRGSLSLSYTTCVLFLPIHLASESPKPRQKKQGQATNSRYETNITYKSINTSNQIIGYHHIPSGYLT
jgi:hypothetical protein